MVLTTIWRSSNPHQGKSWRPATHDVKELRPQPCDPDRVCWLNTGPSTVQIHSFRAYKQNIRTALTTSFKSLFSVSSRQNKMVADGENVDPVVKKIIRQVHWKLKSACLIHFSRWNIISATSTYRGTSSFRKRPSLTTAGWILFFRLCYKYYSAPVLTFYCFAPINTMHRLPWRPCWSSSGYLSYPRLLSLLVV